MHFTDHSLELHPLDLGQKRVIPSPGVRGKPVLLKQAWWQAVEYQYPRPTSPGSGLAMGLLLVQTLVGRTACSLQGAGADRGAIGISSCVKTKPCSWAWPGKKQPGGNDKELDSVPVPGSQLEHSLLLI